MDVLCLQGTDCIYQNTVPTRTIGSMNHASPFPGMQEPLHLAYLWSFPQIFWGTTLLVQLLVSHVGCKTQHTALAQDWSYGLAQIQVSHLWYAESIFMGPMVATTLSGRALPDAKVNCIKLVVQEMRAERLLGGSHSVCQGAQFCSSLFSILMEKKLRLVQEEQDCGQGIHKLVNLLNSPSAASYMISIVILLYYFSSFVCYFFFYPGGSTVHCH